MLPSALGQHQRRGAENLRRITLRLEPAIALGAVALDQRADIGDGADKSIRQKQIEMGGLAGRSDRAAEQALVDEGADHGLLAGAVRRHHDIEQKSRRAGFRRQPAGIDDGGEVGAAEHFGFGRRDTQLIETDAVGRQRDRRGSSPTDASRDAAASGEQRTCRTSWPARTTAAVGYQ